MKRIALILTIILSACFFSTTLHAQVTDISDTLGNKPANNQLRIIMHKGGNFAVYRYNSTRWAKQFYDSLKTPLFSIKIGTLTYSSSGNAASAGDALAAAKPLMNFDTIQDVGATVKVGTLHEMTKRFSGKHRGSPFSVTIKISYNTDAPEFFTKEAIIDATEIHPDTAISFAYGFDTYLASDDAGFAFIVPDIFGLNDNQTKESRYLTQAEVQSLRLVGARNGKSGNAIIAYFPIGRDFDRAWSAYPYQNGLSYNVLALSPTAADTNHRFKFGFGPYAKATGVGNTDDNSQGIGYDNIPAGEITKIKTGLTFTSSLDGELNYFWNEAKNHTAKIGDTVRLDLHYKSYSNMPLYNVGFQIDFEGLPINAKGCTSSGFTNGTSNCVAGNEFYQLSAAEVQPFDSVDISVPITITQAGQWIVDRGSIANITEAFPLGEAAVLTVPTTVSLTDSTPVRIDKGETKQYTIKFPDTATAAQNVTIYLSYYGDKTSFSTLPASVTIPAGANSVSFSITALSGSASNASILITLSSTDKAFAPVAEPSSNLLAIEYEPIRVDACQGDSITLVAAPTNGGDAPTYQWKKNNTPIQGATLDRYTYMPTNGDTIVCEMTTNATCPFPTTVNSPMMIITVKPKLTPTIAINADPDITVCAGTTVSFNNQITNGGTNPTYQWKVNGTNVSTEPTYSYIPAHGDKIVCLLTSSDMCAVPATVASDTIAITVNCATIYGTVFPFVHDTTSNGEPNTEFNNQFPVTARLYAIPDTNTTRDPIGTILNATPLFDTLATYYGDSAVGIYTFKNIPLGDYLLVLSRDGFVTRFAEISVTPQTEFLGYRELVPGDMSRNLQVENADISKVKASFTPLYNPKHDVHSDGEVNQTDLAAIKHFIGFSVLHYNETMTWGRKYK